MLDTPVQYEILEEQLRQEAKANRPEDKYTRLQRRYDEVVRTQRLNRGTIWLIQGDDANFSKEVQARARVFRELSHYPKGFWILGQIMTVPRVIICNGCHNNKRVHVGSWQYFKLYCFECGEYFMQFELGAWPWWKSEGRPTAETE